MIKLTAKPNTWFKENTEVLWEDEHFVSRRPTVSEWYKIKQSDWGAVFRGIRISESINELVDIGTEYIDSELCSWDEFDVEEVI